MEKIRRSSNGLSEGHMFHAGLVVVAVMVLFGNCGSVEAFNIPTGSDDVEARWDNTLRYSLSQRVKKQDSAIIGNKAIDDGDRNFDVGIVSNRLDLLSEADIAYQKNYGVRLSGSFWYDQAYDAGLDNSSIATSNHIDNGAPALGFNPYTRRKFAGPSGQLLDAFAFGKINLGPVPVNLKVGRHAVLWGEAMLGNGGIHGIGYAQAPIDVAKAFGLPGVELKELFRPRNQVSVQIQPSPELTVSGQYFLEWEANRFAQPGTYMSFADVVGNEGSESLFAGPPFHPRAFNGGDIKPRQNGDWGIAARWNPSWLDGTLGLYYRTTSDVFGQAHAKQEFVTGPTGANIAVPINYHWVYASDINIYGISLAKQVAGISVGSELSYRTNMPLLSDGAAIPPGGILPSRGDTLGARGETWHALVNFLYIFKKTPLFDTAATVAEFTWSHVDHVTSRPDLYKGRDGYTAIDRVSSHYVNAACNFSPTWYQVISGVDLSMPLSINIGLSGNSAVSAGGNEGSGQYGFGLSADVFQQYKVDLTYNGFFGSIEGLVPKGPYAALRDRDMITLTLKTSF